MTSQHVTPTGVQAQKQLWANLPLQVGSWLLPAKQHSLGRRKGLHLRSSPSRLGTVGWPAARLASISAAMRCRSATEGDARVGGIIRRHARACQCPSIAATVQAREPAMLSRAARRTYCTSHLRCRRPRARQSGHCSECTRGRRTLVCPQAAPQTTEWGLAGLISGCSSNCPTSHSGHARAHAGACACGAVARPVQQRSQCQHPSTQQVPQQGCCPPWTGWSTSVQACPQTADRSPGKRVCLLRCRGPYVEVA